MTHRPPNVVLLSCDALRVDHLGNHGYDRNTSPYLDEFAEESIAFQNAYSASSHTREAVPALLTGEYPDVAVDSNYRLARDSIASVLSEIGYSTGGFHSNPYVSRAYGFGEGFDTFDDDLHFGKHRLIALAQRALDKIRNRHYARAEVINKRSLNWIDSLEENPFFLWNHYMDTHGPYEPPKGYADQYTDRTISDRKAQTLYQRAISDPKSITDEERRLLINLYDAEIRYNDECIGNFFDELRKREVYEDTLIIITADHGDAFGEHGYYEHPRRLHKEITHVPLLVCPPGGGGKVVNTPVSTLDVAATIRAVSDGSTDVSTSDTVSLLDPPTTDRCVFSQVRGEKEESHLHRYVARSKSDTAFCKRNRETSDVVITSSTCESIRSTLESYVEERVRIGSGETEGGDEEVNEEIERRLEALGYKE